jgi:hypothetical protein
VEEAREIYDSIASRMESEMQAVAKTEWTAKQREAVRFADVQYHKCISNG